MTNQRTCSLQIFLGTANVLEGSISNAGAREIFQSNGGISIEQVKGELGEQSIVFRPQNVVIASTDADMREGRARMSRVVRHTEFLGSIIRYAVDVSGHRHWSMMHINKARHLLLWAHPVIFMFRGSKLWFSALECLYWQNKGRRYA